MKRDGHIHSPYCPHGSTDSFEDYVEKAIKLGFNEISFTEHAPLPDGFDDPTPDKDSGMEKELVEKYIEEINNVKEAYKKFIKVNVGFEIDYIEGYESKTKQFLDKYGSQIDDSILSVHFLKHQSQFYCLDFSEDEFERMITIFGSVEAIYESYYATVLKSIQSDLGLYKPKRIGHITLVKKFQKKFPTSELFDLQINNILLQISHNNYEIDCNGAGYTKPLCQESYPPENIIQQIINLKIPLVYGSDAHTAKGLSQGFDQLQHFFK